jgi:DNA-binding NtrC family response regulator
VQFAEEEQKQVEITIRRFDEMLGDCQAMKQVYSLIERVAPLNVPVLITGETGTGKELVARSLHRRSPRAEEPLMAVNLGAVPQDLLPSELFGHEKGAFTGAAYQKKGRFEQASRGTLFMDEIGAINEKCQVALLRVLESKRYQRVGGRREMQTDARVLAAGNNELEQKVADGLFRQDLFHRLNVFRISLPPLRERGSDQFMLAHHFLDQFCRGFEMPGMRFSERALDFIRDYDWPGNVRELENTILRAVISSEASVLEPEDLGSELEQQSPDMHGKVALDLGLTLAEAERMFSFKTLEAFGGNKSAVAEVLQISRKALYSKLNGKK